MDLEIIDAMIDIKNVTKSFKDSAILKDITMGVERGSICGLIGHNGSGKTVLMKVICGFITPDTGCVRVNGKHIGKDCDFPESVGVIIENPGFAQYMSGKKNLKNLASIRKEIDEKRIDEVMQLVGLQANDKKWVSKYSLGMRQRLGIAQAIMENPELLIFDEPMNGLDQQGIEDMRKLFLDLKNQGKTILLASHNKEDIEILCDKVFEMNSGILTNGAVPKNLASSSS